MATCKDCIHYAVCLLGACINGATGNCLNFKYKSRFIELPCKVGQTVYYNDNNYPYKRNTLTFKCVVNSFDFDFDTGEHIAVLTVLVGGHFFKRTAVKFSDFGKTVFLTRERAEQVLKERTMDEEGLHNN